MTLWDKVTIVRYRVIVVRYGSNMRNKVKCETYNQNCEK